MGRTAKKTKLEVHWVWKRALLESKTNSLLFWRVDTLSFIWTSILGSRYLISLAFCQLG